MNADIDGIAPFSEEPRERLRFMVYEHRMFVEALKTKALLIAAINPERAEKAAQDYMEAAIPISEEARDEQMRARERQLAELADMKPIHLSQLKAGPAMEGSKEWVATSMHHPR
ncbi:MAG: hypothetical protein WC869_00590 [Phycisphaerae bacterium]